MSENKKTESKFFYLPGEFEVDFEGNTHTYKIKTLSVGEVSQLRKDILDDLEGVKTFEGDLPSTLLTTIDGKDVGESSEHLQLVAWKDALARLAKTDPKLDLCVASMEEIHAQCPQKIGLFQAMQIVKAREQSVDLSWDDVDLALDEAMMGFKVGIEELSDKLVNYTPDLKKQKATLRKVCFISSQKTPLIAEIITNFGLAAQDLKPDARNVLKSILINANKKASSDLSLTWKEIANEMDRNGTVTRPLLIQLLKDIEFAGYILFQDRHYGAGCDVTLRIDNLSIDEALIENKKQSNAKIREGIEMVLGDRLTGVVKILEGLKDKSFK